jgi:hypothetical protein
MIPISGFSLENKEDVFEAFRNKLLAEGFIIGGNWDYDHGYFDRALDGVDKVYLRIPFQVTKGQFDGESTNPDTYVQLGTPFVLKHLYEEGLDQDADTGLFSSMVDQFQDPVDPDAPIEDQWVEKAKEVLRQVKT